MVIVFARLQLYKDVHVVHKKDSSHVGNKERKSFMRDKYLHDKTQTSREERQRCRHNSTGDSFVETNIWLKKHAIQEGHKKNT